MILIVDDHGGTRSALAAICRSKGYDTRTAPSGHAALNLMRQLQPSLILLDLHLKDMSGLDVLRAVQPHLRIPQLNVIVFTGERGIEMQAMQLGAVACVIKASQTMDVFWEKVRTFSGEPDLPQQQSAMGEFPTAV
jgi:CheY-like chemotaxis protein